MTKTIGIILFRKKAGKLEYLLLHHGKKYWNFPKGRPDAADKNDSDTAFREVREETGISKNQITLLKNFRAGYVYSFKRPKEWRANRENCKYLEVASPTLSRGCGIVSEKRPLRERRKKITKRAIFYLGLVRRDANIRMHTNHTNNDVKVKISDEHIGFGWFEYKKALQKLAMLKGSDGDSCQLLKKAEKRVTCNL